VTHEVKQFLPFVEQVIQQTAQRVMNEKLPTQEQPVGLFEPHADIIYRGEVCHPIEFGHKIWLDEVDGGIV
jgi:IS5 family transposase